MYIERDAKIVLIYRAIIGLAFFIAFYLVLVTNPQARQNDNFDMILLMVSGLIFILTGIIVGSIVSLKMEISRQEKYLKNLPPSSEFTTDKYVKIPYNKSGLYSLCIASLLGVIAFLYLSSAFLLSPQEYTNQNLELLSIMIVACIFIFLILLLASFYVLLKRIHTPLYHDVKACPRCKSDDVHKVEYSWWGGLIGPGLVHQVRCKKCGYTYDGATGTNISKRVGYFITALLLISFIILLLRLFFNL